MMSPSGADCVFIRSVSVHLTVMKILCMRVKKKKLICGERHKYYLKTYPLTTRRSRREERRKTKKKDSE